MKKQEELFDLIQSLDKQEKVHFKMNASRRDGDKKYLQLFDAIHAQKKYDEPALRKKFAGEPFMRQFSVAKNYLYNTLLRSLRQYHAESNLENVLRDGIHTVEILYNKGLYVQADRLCARMIKKAADSERHLRLFEALRWRRMIQRIQGYPELDGKQLRKITKEESDVFSALKNWWEYDLLSDRYFILATHGGYLSKEQQSELHALLSNPLLGSENRAISNRSRSTFYRIVSRIHHNLGNLERSQQYAEKLIRLYEELPKNQFAEERYNYIIVLYNQLILLTYLKRNKAFENTIAKLRRIVPVNNKERTTIFYTYLTELDFYIANKRYAEGCALEQPVAEGLKRYEGKMNVQVECSLSFNLCVVFIRSGRFNEALRWANRIINSSRYQTVDDFYYATRLLYLIIHYELGNYDTLEYLAESTDRYLKKHAYYGQLEEVLLDFLGTCLPGCTSEKEKITELRLLKKKIAAAAKLPGADKSLHYFDFSVWVEDKLRIKN
ncbi:MAG: hypothetical protein FD123_530 [Bacteroidetes bacterium]|nr:MAG: hypothetical protein FD123_530 [Bacteroidota bacterium]